MAVPEALRRLSVVQGGAISRQQVLGHGISDHTMQRFLREGRWKRIAAGVYRTQPANWLQLAWAGVLLGGDGAVVGRRAAAHLYGWLKEPPLPITIYVPDSQRIRRDDRWQFIRSDRLGRGEPPRTRAAQTILDVAATASADELTTLVAEATAFGRLDPADIVRLVADTPMLRNRRQIVETVQAVSLGAMSPLEARYLRDVERAHRLPAPQRQASPTGRYRTDGWYRDYGIIIELDGATHHRGAARTIDLERDNLHRLSGLITLRFNWRMVTTTPCAVAHQVAEALLRRGWLGTPCRCKRCRLVDFDA